MIRSRGLAAGGLAAVVFFLLIVGCRGFPDEFPAADFTLPDVFTKEKIRFADYRGRPVILYWFTSW